MLQIWELRVTKCAIVPGKMLHGKRSLGLAVGILMISIEIVEVKSSRKKLDPGHRNSSGQVERLYKEVDSRMIKIIWFRKARRGDKERKMSCGKGN